MGINNQTTVTIDNKTLLDKLVKIAIPIAIQGVVSATLGLVDNLMVGFLGEADLAAVGIATQVYFIRVSKVIWGFSKIIWGPELGNIQKLQSYLGAGVGDNFGKNSIIIREEQSNICSSRFINRQ